jgi:calcineurin-like phosphoesterase family protein
MIGYQKNKEGRFIRSFQYIALALLFLTCSCKKFEFSPFEIPGHDDIEKDLNPGNVETIILGSKEQGDIFYFAIISDSHSEYTALGKAINRINSDKDIRFVIHLGDLTDHGIYKEYKWTNDMMSRLRVPYIMVIGNHDYLANGESLFGKIYGPSSFSFVYNRSRFVCFNSIVWENNNAFPDFNWLKEALSDNGPWAGTYVFSHIPPFSSEYNLYFESLFVQTLTSGNVRCSFHGHVHRYSLERHYKSSDTRFFTATCIGKREFYKVMVADTAFNIERISF